MQTQDQNSALRNLSALVDFSNLINSSLDVEFTFNNLLLTCLGKFHTSRGCIAIKRSDNFLEIRSSKGLVKETINNFPDVRINDLDEDKEFKAFLTKNKLELCQRIISSEGEIGILMLGERFGGNEYREDDKNFLKTLLNIAATAIDNASSVEKLKNLNRQLDGKVNQLSSLFDLSKEFSGILERDMIGKLLVFSIIGQLMVSKYAVVICEGSKIEYLENKFPEEKLSKAFRDCLPTELKEVLQKGDIQKRFPILFEIGITLLIPMQIQGETKGLVLLGSRRSGEEFSKSDIEYVSSVGSLAIISIENARLFEETVEKQKLEKDLELARNIQQNLLPNKIPVMKNYEIATFNKSARQVGGDYYDLVKLDEHRVLFAVGDVSGKGVQAALLMANLQAFLQSVAKQNFPLAEATNLINDLVSGNTTMGSFITFFWGIIDDSNKKLTFVNAGHNPPLLVRNNELIKLKKGGMILGVMETMIPYESETIELSKDDVIVLFTDGITEAMNKDLEEYTDERLEKLLSNMGNNTANETLEKIIEDVNIFTAGAEQSDDITCLVIKYL
ncbi:MAG: SpoIIE family protein phosphatase [Melioribacteraceae bacterium]|jgi:sigma-B regulation protein RsbU (phosphoserine phosphatase)|nr:MAG: SpoIIE family protein phosphatase [Melioribacteraceae bacterium]